MSTPSLSSYSASLENGFFGRWIKNFRISLMLTILLIGYGLYAAIQIPKESSPEIKFGLVSVNTVYPGTNPIDMDELITTKLEDTIDDLDGIDKIESTSSVGVSSIVITLDNETNTKDFLNELKTTIDKVTLPDDAKDPIVTEISTANEVLFELMLYGSAEHFSMNHMRSLGYHLADRLKGKGPIIDAQIGAISRGGGGQASSSDDQFDVQVLVDEKKMQQLGLTLGQVTQAIRAFNTNLPLGNHELGELNYDYRIKGKLSSFDDLMNVPLSLGGRGPIEYIRLSDIALVQRNYKDQSIGYGGSYNHSNNLGVKVVIYKEKRSNIFADAGQAKTLIAHELKKPLYKGINIDYTTDLSEVIIDDYKSLAGNARQSVLLIFLIMWLFVGLKQSMIATFAMPLAFFITFIFLNSYGYTLNFLTNFSLVLSFGMGIDTVVVIIEAAYELMKKGFNSKTAVLLALKQYGKPNITSSLANMVVFLPMLALPGITGKFLAYIPITIFCTLAASLFLASSINNALFWKINNNQKWYYKEKKYGEGEEDEDILLSPEDVVLLEQERQGKEARDPESQPRIDQKINGIAHRYSNKLHRLLERRFWRRWTYRGPVVGLILSFVFLSGSIGFKLFPSGDNEFMDIEVKTLVGTKTQGMIGLLPQIDQIISHIPEVRNYSLQARNNTIDIGIRLVKKNQRTRNSFTIQDDIDTQLSYLKTQGYTVQSKVQAGGPPVGKAVGIELIAEHSHQLSQLKHVANQIETYIKSLTGTINVTNSSQTNPGQFVFTRDKTKLAELGLTPNDIQGEIRPALIGQNAGTLSIDGKERDIIVQYEGFDQVINPETILSTVVNTRQGPIMIGSVMTYSIDQSLNSVSRKDGELTIIVDADLKQGLKPTDFQPKLIQYAQSYQFPPGIGFKAGGENEANKELIQAAGVAFIIAIFLTFLILIYQFNSFKQSVMILYSIITALLGVNIGLRLTGNPYSMPFMIGFISLIGIVVNNAIFIIDKINNNLTLGAGLVEAIVDAGKTRFKPVIISSLTTIFGIITLAWKDEFWAGLAYTVVFGLLFSSFMTLIAIPNIYYAVYKKRLLTTNNNESLSDNK